jgi:hypothetical protein
MCVSLWTAALSAAELRFNRYFTDNMVLQRDKPNVIRGSADKGAVVTVEFAGQKQSTTAGGDGAWSVALAPMPANAERQKLTATSPAGKARAELSNILVGDVFLFACQANVDISLGKDEAGRKIAGAEAGNPLYRAISIKTIPSCAPMADLAAGSSKGWVAVNGRTAVEMSAPAYLFGKTLAANGKVPVGVIDLNMGKNFTIGWLSREALMGSDSYFGKPTEVVAYLKDIEEEADFFSGRKKITDPRQNKRMPKEDPITDPRYPAAGYNAVLHPLKGTALKGILLQLGNDYPYLIYEKMAKAGEQFDREQLESAWMDSYTLRKESCVAAPLILPRVPYQWRGYFADPGLPMALIMPPGSPLGTYAMHNVQIRELQRRTAAANPDVGLIMPGNEAMPFSGQPADAVLLATRASSWALGAVYNKQGMVGGGPLFEKLDVNYSTARVIFKAGTSEGLMAAPGALEGFELAGLDAKFLPAKATIEGNTILLRNDDIAQISHVRYNWREVPVQGLVNGAELPVVPFRTDDCPLGEVPKAAEANLPMEYTTPACDWKSSDVAIISGSGGRYVNDGFLGSTGLKVRPFGPNMLVELVMPGSPADGKILSGDMIYGLNGKILNNDPARMVADAITQAETEAGAGRISFGLRRNGKNKEIPLKLEVLGTYSATSPYNCPKTDRIVANMEEYLARRGGEASSAAGGGWLHTDTLFLLAAGNPKYQGLVRRVVYDLMASIDPKTTEFPKGGTWSLAYRALLLGEYYLATGDRNVLPWQKWYCDALAATQVKKDSFPDMLPGEYGGWRHNYPGGRSYGMLPPIGLPGVIGYRLADEAGVDLNRESYDLALRTFRDGQAEMGDTHYSARITPIKAPQPLDTVRVAEGRVWPHHCGTSAILFKLLGDTRIAHLNSLYCVFAFNICDEGHGSNFFNGMWTPLGAYVHSKDAFVNFMRNHHWFQDLRRTFNHSYKPSTDESPGMGHGLSLVVPRQRLRILGAPESVFAKGQEAFLQPALKAYQARDYKHAEALSRQLLAAGEVPKEDRIKIEQLARAAKEIQESIQFDLGKVGSLVAAGKLYEASLDIPQLKGILPDGDARLAILEREITLPESKASFAADQKRYQDEQKSLVFRFAEPEKKDSGSKDGWISLTTEAGGGTLAEKDANAAKATQWRVKIVESLSLAPAGWAGKTFDDGGWGTTSLPISWYLDHTFLGRAKFEVKDKSAIKSLRIKAFTFRQQDIEVYLNGKLVAKINNCGASGDLDAELTPAAVDALRNGHNILAVTSRNDWRWGVYDGIRNGGFGFRLEARGASLAR